MRVEIVIDQVSVPASGDAGRSPDRAGLTAELERELSRQLIQGLQGGAEIRRGDTPHLITRLPAVGMDAGAGAQRDLAPPVIARAVAGGLLR